MTRSFTANQDSDVSLWLLITSTISVLAYKIQNLPVCYKFTNIPTCFYKFMNTLTWSHVVRHNYVGITNAYSIRAHVGPGRDAEFITHTWVGVKWLLK